MTIPNTPAIHAGNTLYIGGTPPVDSEGNLIAANDVGKQTAAIFERMDALLAQAGMTREHLVFVTVYLLDLTDYTAMNSVYAENVRLPYPARKVIQTPLTIDGMRVEMTAIASTQPRLAITV